MTPKTDPPDRSLPPRDQILFEAEADITSDGALSASRLIVSKDALYKIEKRPTGEESVQVFPTEGLHNAKVIDLVDSIMLVVGTGPARIELLRGTSGKRTQLATAAKKLEALLKGEEIPDFEDEERVCPRCGRPLPEDTNVCPACVNKGRTLLRLFEFTRPYKLRLVWACILVAGGTAIALLPPYLTKHLVDDVLTQRQTAWFLPLLGGLILCQFAQNLIQMARGRNVAYLSANVAVDIRTKLFHKLQQLSLSFYDKRNVGSLMSRMTNDTGALYDVLVDGIPITLNNAAMLIGIPIAMLLMDWQIALWALLPVPLVLYAVNRFRKKMMRVWSRFWHSWSRMSSSLNGTLQGTRVVKAFAGENREEAKFGRRIQDLAHTGYTAEIGWSNFFPMVMFVMSLSGFVIWFTGGQAVLGGRMTTGELISFTVYATMMREPLMSLQRFIDWVSRSLTAAERVFEILDTPLDIEDTTKSLPMPIMNGAVRFDGVYFGYEKAREIIHDITLDVQAGEMIGLVGHSGAGKSTLINMLMRFYDPTRGHVYIDGVDIRHIKIDDLRRQVGVVLQDNYLFPGSVKDNIAYGRPDASLHEIIEAAKAANAHHFIVNFPDGYDTYVGERGHRLSGGERQRIAIARAILHNPRILILDEATASVDTETERMIQEGLDRLVSGRTVFAIAHRLSTLRNADRLVVMEDGRIVEIGTHDELLANPVGIYTKLVNMQKEMNRTRANFMGVESEETSEELASASS